MKSKSISSSILLFVVTMTVFVSKKKKVNKQNTAIHPNISQMKIINDEFITQVYKMKNVKRYVHDFHVFDS